MIFLLFCFPFWFIRLFYVKMVFDTDSSPTRVVWQWWVVCWVRNLTQFFIYVWILSIDSLIHCSNKNNKQFVNFSSNLIACLVSRNNEQIVIFVWFYRMSIIAILQLTTLQANDSARRKKKCDAKEMSLIKNQYFTLSADVVDLTFHFLRVYTSCSYP